MSLNQDVKVINANNANNIVSKLDEVQVELVSGLGSVSDIQENYALWMCHTFTVLNTGVDRATMTLSDYSIGKGVAIHWFDFTSNQLSGKAVKARRDSYKSAMEASVNEHGHRRFSENNIDKIWSRIKELSGKGSKAKESETDKSCDAVNLKELATILRRIQKAELSKEYMPKSIKAHTTIELAYELIGGSLADVYKPEK
jgi:hypothetical protein